MAASFRKRGFAGNGILLFSMKKSRFFTVTCTFLAHFSVLLLVSITFQSAFEIFWSLREIQKSKIADPRWLTLWQSWRNFQVTSCHHSVWMDESNILNKHNMFKITTCRRFEQLYISYIELKSWILNVEDNFS